MAKPQPPYRQVHGTIDGLEPTAEELELERHGTADLAANEVHGTPLRRRARALRRGCMACNREKGEPMCELCWRLERAEAQA